jgi:hypothetical protein
MSKIDLGNPGVLANFIKTRMREANGKVVEKEKVAVYVDETYGEFIVPPEMEVEVKEKVEKKKAAKKPAVKKEEPKKAPVKK